MLSDIPAEDTLNWEAEANAIIRDISSHVTYIGISKKLENSSYEIFLNLKTLEGKDFCIRASGSGFAIVGEEFDTINQPEASEDDDADIFETPYALLNTISPSYVQSFANQLTKQLKSLENSQ